MKKFTLAFCFGLILILVYRCSPSKYSVSSYGDEATLEFIDGSKHDCEIICFSDTTVIFSFLTKPYNKYNILPKALYYVNNKELKSISIHGFDGSDWGTDVLGSQVFPVGLLAAAAAIARTNVLPVVLIFGIPAVITSLILSASDGEMPQWNEMDSLSEISDLNIYTRYPNGLSDVELIKLFEKSGQKELKKFVVNY